MTAAVYADPHEHASLTRQRFGDPAVLDAERFQLPTPSIPRTRRGEPRVTDQQRLTPYETHLYSLLILALHDIVPTQPEMAEALGISLYATRRLCRKLGVLSLPGRRPNPKPRSESVGACRVCGVDEERLDEFLRMPPHYRLGPRVRGVRVAVKCPGSNQPARIKEGTK